jgi:hypothetical protein
MDEFKKINASIEVDREKTQLKKEQFIKQIKSGLGDHIKQNGSKVKILKKPFLTRIWETLIKIF